MITGTKRIDLTPENILKRISEFDVIHYYLRGSNWKLNEPFCSPLRNNDEHPSFLVGNRNGFIFWIDFATNLKGDVFEFVRTLYGLSSLDEVLRLIDKDFGLGILPENNTKEYEKIITEYEQPEEEIGKHYTIIQCITRKFTLEELGYWSEFHIDITDLQREHIYSLSKVYLNRRLFPLKETELRFGYFAPEEGHWKIYRPFVGKKSKWTPNNISSVYLEGKENINNCQTAFIHKSRKDRIMMSKIFPCSCSVQNESIGCFSPENVEYLKANSDRQILGFDSDVPGVANSQQITKLFNFGYCNVPRTHLSEGIKDFADWGRIYGLKVINDYLIERGIL